MTQPSNAVAARVGRAVGYVPGMVRGGIERMIAQSRHTVFDAWLRNPRSHRRYLRRLPALTAVQRKAAIALSKRGIAFVDRTDLGIEAEAYDRIASMVATFAASQRVTEAIGAFRSDFGRKEMKGDDYMVKLYPEGPTLRLDNPLLQIGLSPAVLNVVNSYLQLWAKLVYTDAWHTIPVDMGKRIGSQGWHRDPEDRRMIKVYLYLADVTEDAGPMEYVVGSASGGMYERLWRWRALATQAQRYPDPGLVEHRIAGAERVGCTGPAGTVIFCDTSGIHRGGIARGHARILATWTFVTPASLAVTSKRRFRIEGGGEVRDLSPAAQYALSDEI